MNPGPQDLCEVNKLLLAVAELSGSAGSALSNDVHYLCSSIVLGGRKHDHKRSVSLGTFLGFIASSGDYLALTPNGKKYLARNPINSYELTSAQKDYLLAECVFNGKLQSQSRFLLGLFVRDYKRDTWVIDTTDRYLPKSLQWLVALMIGLGVLEAQDTLLLVTEQYVPAVTQLISARLKLSQDELDRILRAKRRIGDLGEAIVEQFEKARLRSLGRVAEADMVRRVSAVDSAAGFDLQSFNGLDTGYDYDRFIEVKASTDIGIRFYWSQNEYATAQVLAEQYWLYFCSGLDPKDLSTVHLVLIQNPADRLAALGLTMLPSEYLVTSVDARFAPETTTTMAGFEITIL